jgi:HEPN domain-containing protein
LSRPPFLWHHIHGKGAGARAMTNIHIKKLFNYWKEEAEYSWSVVDSLFEKKKYAESLFFAHLSLEKQLKALVVARDKKHAPPIHNLIKLLGQSGIVYDQSHITAFGRYNKFYMAGRYDEQKMQFRKKCTLLFTRGNLEKMREYYLWLKKEIEKTSHLL